MAATIPTVKLSHDDNLAEFIRSDTTLVLSGSTFAVTQNKVDNLSTSRLLIYSDVVLLTGRIKCPGREIQIHCNRLEWDDGTVIDVTGKSGETIAALAPQPASDGQTGGTVYIHVHNLDPELKDLNQTLWPKSLEFICNGGAPGQCHDTETTWKPGKTGEAGSAIIYYSNNDWRSFAMLYDLYYLGTTTQIERLTNLLRQAVPRIRGTNEAYSKTIGPKIDEIEQMLTTLIQFHVNCTKLLPLMRNSLASVKVKEVSKTLQLQAKRMQVLTDYSMIPPAVCQKAQRLLDLLSGNDPSEASSKSPTTIDVARETAATDFMSSLEAALVQAEARKDVSTPLAKLVNSIFDDFVTRQKAVQNDKNIKATPGNALKISQVTYSITGKDDMIVKIPLVHPDQCQMELRSYDKDYFAENLDSAMAGYNNIRERLAFVPRLQREVQAVAGGKTPSPLFSAYYKLEKVDRLSNWTLETLGSIYTLVCSRLEQISLKQDLFGLPSDWVPRLSAQFYTHQAVQQLERLRSYEDSYWQFFDDYQAQMEAGHVLKAAMAANVYRRKDGEDAQAALIQLMKTKEEAIEQAAADIESKRLALMENLKKVETLMNKAQWPSAATICTAMGSVITAGVFLATGPVGWVAGIGLAGAAVAAQGLTIYDEATETIKNTHGEQVNKKFLINKLAKCETDIKSLLDQPAYSMAADGTKNVNEADTVKITATAEQLTAFLDQFQESVNTADGKVKDELKKTLQAYTKATNARNADILAYSNAVIQSYELIKQQILLDKQASDISGQLIKENIGLPSIVAYYSRIRDSSRISILRNVKFSALALRYIGLKKPLKFSVSLMSNVDELEAHMDVLRQEHEAVLSNFASFAQCSWPYASSDSGIIYQLSDLELGALKVGLTDPWFLQNGISLGKTVPKVHSVSIDTLAKNPATLTSSHYDSPFAGFSNVRISQVRFWLPGLRVKPLLKKMPGAQTSSKDQSVSGPSSVQLPPPKALRIDLKQESVESIVSPNNTVNRFTHEPIYLPFSYRWESVTNASDMLDTNILATHSLSTETRPKATSNNSQVDSNSDASQAMYQAPIGPFATWTITLRERENGPLDWSNVDSGFLEFTGNGIPFRW